MGSRASGFRVLGLGFRVRAKLSSQGTRPLFFGLESRGLFLGLRVLGLRACLAKGSRAFCNPNTVISFHDHGGDCGGDGGGSDDMTTVMTVMAATCFSSQYYPKFLAQYSVTLAAVQEQ